MSKPKQDCCEKCEHVCCLGCSPNREGCDCLCHKSRRHTEDCEWVCSDPKNHLIVKECRCGVPNGIGTHHKNSPCHGVSVCKECKTVLGLGDCRNCLPPSSKDLGKEEEGEKYYCQVCKQTKIGHVKCQEEGMERRFDSEFTEIDPEFRNRYMKGGGSPMQIKDFIEKESILAELERMKKKVYSKLSKEEMGFNDALEALESFIKK